MIIVFSIIGMIVCIAILFPQIRRMIIDLAEHILHKEASMYQSWLKAFLSYAMGGICFILFFDYCTLTDSGKVLVQKVKQEIKESLSEIDFRSLRNPVLLMSGVYLLGILTIIRADFSYLDDLRRSVVGYRGWYDWSRYIAEFSSIFIHGDTNLTDISPIPQLLSIFILAISSVILVYVINNKKVTAVGLLACIPLGLSPYYLECLAYKFDAPYMALSILTSIAPFIFVTHRKAFFFCSIVSLLVMCMTYQAASGIYPVIVLILCFRDWNNRTKPDKEILSFLGTAALAFCLTMLLFKFFFVKPFDEFASGYASTTMYPMSQIISGTLNNITKYAMVVNHDFSMIWKIGIALVLFFFVTKSIYKSAHKKILSFFASIIVIGISFILSYGVYLLLKVPIYFPRALFGFGVFLAGLCIYVASDYKKIATAAVLALNWCFLVFAFSFGNALADQARYAEFRTSILLHDLNTLNSGQNGEGVQIQLKNSIDFAPSIKNIAKHYPLIEKLVPKRLSDYSNIEKYYLFGYFNYNPNIMSNTSSENNNDFSILNLPVVLDSYYHTIHSDGNRILIVLKH